METVLPGMNPYLEQPSNWQGFHTILVVEMWRMLVPQLDEKYEGRVVETLTIREPPAAERRVRADGAVVLTKADGQATSPRDTAAALTAPTAHAAFFYDTDLVEDLQRSIEIRSVADEAVISVIELISPTNKTTGRSQYAGKRRQLVEGGVNVLQIDLLRAGGNLLPTHADLPEFDYSAMLVRSQTVRQAAGGMPYSAKVEDTDIWTWRLRDATPTLPIPLLPGDADVPLQVQEALDRVTEAGGAPKSIYRSEPQPPLAPDDREWARGLLVERGLVPVA